MGIASNLWKLKLDRFLGDFWAFAPILVPFFKSHGLSATEIFTIEATYNVVMAVSDIPTGYFSDIMGRKTAMILSAVLRPLALTIYLLSDSFWGFVLAEASLGFSASLRSGTDSALLYDTLVEIGREKEHKKLEGGTHFFSSLGTSVAGVLGGFLAAISIRLPFFATMATSLILIPLDLSIKEPVRKTASVKNIREHYIEVVRTIKFCLHHKAVLYAGLYFVLIANLSGVGIWSYYLYFTDLGIGVAYYGFLAAMLWFFSAIGAKLCDGLCQRLGENATLWMLLAIAPLLILMGQFKSLWALPIIAINAMLFGMSFPLLRDVIHRNTRSSRRATVLSVVSMGRRLAYVFFAVTTGSMTDMAGIQAGLVTLGLLGLVLGVFPALQLIRAK